MNKLNIVDMFCGGGGESTGLIEAAHDYNFDVNMSAINHWERANKALNKLMCRIIKTVMNYQN